MSFLYKKKVIPILIILAIFGIGIIIFGIYRGSSTEAIALNGLVYEGSVIGKSVEGRLIEAHTFSPAEAYASAGRSVHLLFVGGIHGGYEWNSVLLSYKFIDYLKENPNIVPNNIVITVIPSANPDGLYDVVGTEGLFSSADVLRNTKNGLGRFNANEVDLNRNFDCKWQPESMWRGNTVSAGTEAFSEPEALVIRDFVLKNNPDAVIFWHSQSNAVYASECEEGILSETLDIMNAYSKASGYKPVESFDHYEITGDAEGWLASIGIPAITVELSTHETVEWEKNLAGIKALFGYYGEVNILREQ